MPRGGLRGGALARRFAGHMASPTYVAHVSLPRQLVEALEAHAGPEPAPLSVHFDADSARIEFGSDAFPLSSAASAGDLAVMRSTGRGQMEMVGTVDEIVHANREGNRCKRPAGGQSASDRRAEKRPAPCGTGKSKAGAKAKCGASAAPAPSRTAVGAPSGSSATAGLQEWVYHRLALGPTTEAAILKAMRAARNQRVLSLNVGDADLRRLLEEAATVGEGGRFSLRSEHMPSVSATWKHYTKEERATLELTKHANSFAVQSGEDYARLRRGVQSEDDYVRMRRQFDEQYPRYTQVSSHHLPRAFRRTARTGPQPYFVFPRGVPPRAAARRGRRRAEKIRRARDGVPRRGRAGESGGAHHRTPVSR